MKKLLLLTAVAFTSLTAFAQNCNLMTMPNTVTGGTTYMVKPKGFSMDDTYISFSAEKPKEGATVTSISIVYYLKVTTSTHSSEGVVILLQDGSKLEYPKAPTNITAAGQYLTYIGTVELPKADLEKLTTQKIVSVSLGGLPAAYPEKSATKLLDLAKCFLNL